MPAHGCAHVAILDFSLVTQVENITPVVLLGEVTFHPYHGGLAIIVPVNEHPWATFAVAYYRNYGKNYEPQFRCPIYFCEIIKESVELEIRNKAD